ncbi:MAG: hypothetical protein GWP06_10725 [Actinobacteria bacterium]|nr:hypothetical protein [Actinomycetota bacterium]
MPKYNIKVNKDSAYKVHPISGIWGGLSPIGLIVADFFHEKMEIPNEMIVNVDEDSGIASEEKVESLTLQRNVLFCASMTPGVAKSIGTWLLKKVEEFEKLNQGNK